MGNFSRQQRSPYSNTYNPGWAEHPNFSYWINNVLQPPQKNCPSPQGTQHQQPRENLENMITHGMKNT